MMSKFREVIYVIVLQSKVGIGVPTTTDVNLPADTTSYVEQVTRQFCEWFGGTTIDEKNGGYVTRDGQLVAEPIFWVISYCTTRQLETYLLQVMALAKTICRELKQESVAVIVNSTMILVTEE